MSSGDCPLPAMPLVESVTCRGSGGEAPGGAGWDGAAGTGAVGDCASQPNFRELARRAQGPSHKQTGLGGSGGGRPVAGHAKQSQSEEESQLGSLKCQANKARQRRPKSRCAKQTQFGGKADVGRGRPTYEEVPVQNKANLRVACSLDERRDYAKQSQFREPRNESQLPSRKEVRRRDGDPASRKNKANWKRSFKLEVSSVKGTKPSGEGPRAIVRNKANPGVASLFVGRASRSPEDVVRGRTTYEEATCEPAQPIRSASVAVQGASPSGGQQTRVATRRHGPVHPYYVCAGPTGLTRLKAELGPKRWHAVGWTSLAGSRASKMDTW